VKGVVEKPYNVRLLLLIFRFPNKGRSGIVLGNRCYKELLEMREDIYKEGEEFVIAQIAMYTGNLFLVDDAAVQWVPEGTNFISLDVEDNIGAKLVPVVATRQGGKRYILIPLDDAIDLPSELSERVVIEKDEPADVPE